MRGRTQSPPGARVACVAVRLLQGVTPSETQMQLAADRPRPPPPPRRGLAYTSSWRVRGAPTWAWVSPAREAGRGAVGSHDPPSPSPSHTHISSALPSLGLCLDVRGYYSRRFHVQSCGHVFQVLIKLPRKNFNHTHTERVPSCSITLKLATEVMVYGVRILLHENSSYF